MSEMAEALDNEELDVISMIASQGEDTDNYDDEDDEGESSFSGELPDDPAELKKLYLETQERLDKKLKFLKNSKKANHRIQNEMSELKAQFDTFKNQSVQSKPDESGAKDEEYKEALEQWRESVADDPSKAIDFATWQSTNMQTQMVDYIAQMQNSFEAKLAEMAGKTDPERIKYQSQINALKANPDFADVPEATLIKFIKATGKVKLPRGAVGGKVASQANKSLDEQVADARKQYDEYYKNGV